MHPRRVAACNCSLVISPSAPLPPRCAVPFGLSENVAAKPWVVSLNSEPRDLRLGCLRKKKGCPFATRKAPVSIVALHGCVLERFRFRGLARSERAQEDAFWPLGLADLAHGDEFPDMECDEARLLCRAAFCGRLASCRLLSFRAG